MIENNGIAISCPMVVCLDVKTLVVSFDERSIKGMFGTNPIRDLRLSSFRVLSRLPTTRLELVNTIKIRRRYHTLMGTRYNLTDWHKPLHDYGYGKLEVRPKRTSLRREGVVSVIISSEYEANFKYLPRSTIGLTILNDMSFVRSSVTNLRKVKLGYMGDVKIIAMRRILTDCSG